MNFNTWLDTFLEEKGIDLEQRFNLKDTSGTSHSMPYGVVVEHIKIAPKNEKESIKKIIAQIDFINGDVKHFFQHLAQSLVG